VESTVVLAEPFFQEDVISMLPYQEASARAPLDMEELSIMMIDDRRVVTVQVHDSQWMLNVYAFS